MSRTYGGDGTIHRTGYLDVEVGPDGRVCAVWFRCQALPFEEHRVGEQRASAMRSVGMEGLPRIVALELEDR